MSTHLLLQMSRVLEAETMTAFKCLIEHLNYLGIEGCVLKNGINKDRLSSRPNSLFFPAV